MDRVKFLLLGLILLGCIIVPLATKAAPRSHLGDIEAPYRADGIATADIDLGTGGYSLILADGAAGSATGSWYFLNDTDSGAYWKGADNWSLMANGGDKLRITASAVVAEVAINSRGVNYNSGGDYIIGAACDAAGTTGNVCFGGALTTFDENIRVDGGTVTVADTTSIVFGDTNEVLKETSSRLVAEARHGFVARISVDEATADRGPLEVGKNSATTELTASSGVQFGIHLDQQISQSGTAAMRAHWLQINDQGSGSGQDYLAYWDWNADSVPEFTMTDAGVAGFADYTRHHDVPIGAAIVGAAAPAVETIGTFRCYVFDANADLAHISVEVPSEWNGTSDMAIDVLIFTDSGDALGNGEVIEFDLVYRSVDEGEAYDNGTAVTINANVTGGASEVDKGQYKITATVDYDDTDQPLAVNDTLGFSIMRDVTTGDTYSGDVHVCRAQLVYTANALATH